MNRIQRSTPWIIISLAALAIAATLVHAQVGGGYDLSWSTVDGGGGTSSTGGVYTLAGIIRYSMPYLDPGSLSDEDAQHLAAFITSKPRPAYPFKDQDYLAEKLPTDAVYYPKR